MSACMGCGKEILWGKLPSGGTIPLDTVAPVYTVTGEYDPSTDRNPYEAFKVARVPLTYVSHFATCSRANQFSGKNKAAKNG